MVVLDADVNGPGRSRRARFEALSTRIPLASVGVVRGNAGALAEHDDDSVRERAEAIRGQTDELVTLVTGVRSVAAVSTDDIEVEPVDPVTLLDEVTDSRSWGRTRSGRCSPTW